MKRYQNGKIEVIVGPMFAGKSAKLINTIRRYGYSGVKTLVIKPAIDSRHDAETIKSRTGAEIDTVIVKSAKEILNAFDGNNYSVVAIDEAQFFNDDLVEVVTKLAKKDIRVIISALDLDFDGNPFGVTPKLLAIAEKVTKLSAICMKCGNDASMSYRKNKSKEIIEIGDNEYEARCRSCHK